MNVNKILYKYKINYLDAILHQVYFPFDKMDEIINDPEILQVTNTNELSLLFFKKCPELFEKTYADSIFHPLVWVHNSPDFIKEKGLLISLNS